jgi:hypothetical protein
LTDTVDYINERLSNAVGFDTQKDVTEYALRQVLIKGHYLEFGVFTGGTILFMAKRAGGAGSADRMHDALKQPLAFVGGFMLITALIRTMILFTFLFRLKNEEDSFHPSPYFGCPVRAYRSGGAIFRAAA